MGSRARGRGGQGRTGPRGIGDRRRLQKLRGWRNPELPGSSQRSFSWRIYSSELIVWLGTVVRMLPCKLHNSCPLFNLFDLDYNNLLCALGLFF